MRLGEGFPTVGTRAALLLTVLALGNLAAMSQEVPCLDPAQLNARTSGDMMVLLNLPHDWLYCSAIVSKFFIIGVWSERHQLVLNESRPFSDSVHPDVTSHSAWQAIDVTEASRRAHYDFLLDESRGLTRDTEYFVALSGCDTLRCRTAGFVKVTPWRQTLTYLTYIMAGCGGALAVTIIIIILVFLLFRWRRSRTPAEDTKSLEGEDNATYILADRAHVGRINQTSNNVSEVDSGLGGLGSLRASAAFDDIDHNAAEPPVLLTTFSGGQREQENTYDEIHEHGLAGQLDQEEDTYDEINYLAADQFTRDTAVAGALADGTNDRTLEASRAVANSAYMYMYASDAGNSASTAEHQWVTGEENPSYRADLYSQMISSKNDIERHSEGTSNPAYEIEGNPDLSSAVN